MIYFARVGGRRWIKIGCSRNVFLRLKQLEHVYGEPINFLGEIPGEFSEERWVHDRFAHIRAPKGRSGRAPELFKMCDELMESIENKGPILMKRIDFSLNCFCRAEDLGSRQWEFAQSEAAKEGKSITQYILEKTIQACNRDRKLERMVRAEIELAMRASSVPPPVLEQPLFEWADGLAWSPGRNSDGSGSVMIIEQATKGEEP